MDRGPGPRHRLADARRGAARLRRRSGVRRRANGRRGCCFPAGFLRRTSAARPLSGLPRRTVVPLRGAGNRTCRRPALAGALHRDNCRWVPPYGGSLSAARPRPSRADASLASALLNPRASVPVRRIRETAEPIGFSSMCISDFTREDPWIRVRIRVRGRVWRWRSRLVSSSCGRPPRRRSLCQGISIIRSARSPLRARQVLVEGTKLEAKSSEDGSYSIQNVPAGTYHLLVVARGFVPTRAELTVAASAVTLDVNVNPELHYSEVVSVSPDARNQFESYQPTTVLAGEDLAKQLQGTVGATLSEQPGVAERSFGPGPSRPVIRGLDGDRVLILEDGQRGGDLSSQSGDHGVTVNPAGSTRIEVVRGPATLLYGANAIGGLVNVISDAIPTEPVTATRGGVVVDLGSVAAEAGGAADLVTGNGQWALHVSGSGRRSGDVDTPAGEIPNSQSRGGFGSVGLAWTGEQRYFGASYGYDDMKYGIPVVEEGQVELTPRRHMFGLRAGASDLGGPFEAVRFLLGYRQSQARGAGSRRSGHGIREQHIRHQRSGPAPARGTVDRNDRRRSADPRVRGFWRRGAVATR